MEDSGRVWGFVLRSCEGNILMVVVKKGTRFVSAKLEEARSCLFTLQCAKEAGYDSLVVEGDFLS